MFDTDRYRQDEYKHRFFHIVKWLSNSMGNRIKIVMFVIHNMTSNKIRELPTEMMNGISELMLSNMLPRVYEIDIKMYDLFYYLLHEGYEVSLETQCACKEDDSGVTKFANI